MAIGEAGRPPRLIRPVPGTLELAVEHAGGLFLGIDDPVIHDNKGSLEVEVEILDPPANQDDDANLVPPRKGGQHRCDLSAPNQMPTIIRVTVAVSRTEMTRIAAPISKKITRSEQDGRSGDSRQ